MWKTINVSGTFGWTLVQCPGRFLGSTGHNPSCFQVLPVTCSDHFVFSVIN